MKYCELSSLLLKLSGLLIFIVTVINIPNYFVSYYSLQNFYGNSISDVTTIVVAVAIPLLISLLIALALFKFPGIITNTLIIKSKEENEINLVDLPSVVFVGIGTYFVAFALADIVYWVSYFVLIEKDVMGGEFLISENTARVISTVAELVIGLILLFGAKGISDFVMKARTYGT